MMDIDMKSSIKVTYESRFGNEFTDKEPLIRVDLIPSDDPRDILLGDIFKKDDGFVPVAAIQRNPGRTVGSGQYVIYREAFRERLIREFGEPVHMALLLYTGTKALFVVSNTEIYFELDQQTEGTYDPSKVIRSGGIKDHEIDELKYARKDSWEKDKDFKERLVKEWQDLEVKIKEKQSEQK